MEVLLTAAIIVALAEAVTGLILWRTGRRIVADRKIILSHLYEFGNRVAKLAEASAAHEDPYPNLIADLDRRIQSLENAARKESARR